MAVDRYAVTTGSRFQRPAWVFALRMTSWSQDFAVRARPGMREWCGVRHSAATAFSLTAQMPMSGYWVTALELIGYVES